MRSPFTFLATLAFLVCAAFACKDAETPKNSAAGEECAVGTHVTHPCAAGLTCKEKAYVAPVFAPNEVHSPEKPSDVGGGCGGVAGFHCADGLTCDMPADQQMVADGMGSCARSSTCQ